MRAPCNIIQLCWEESDTICLGLEIILTGWKCDAAWQRRWNPLCYTVALVRQHYKSPALAPAMELSPDVASIMDFRQASVVVFEKKGVVSMEWASEAAKILDEHGFFYQANEEIGSLCGELYNEYVNNEELKQFMPHLMPMDVRIPRLRCHSHTPPSF